MGGGGGLFSILIKTGMPSPAGYRTALRLFQLAERFGLPVVTLVDTCGAWPSFEASEWIPQREVCHVRGRDSAIRVLLLPPPSRGIMYREQTACTRKRTEISRSAPRIPYRKV